MQNTIFNPKRAGWLIFLCVLSPLLDGFVPQPLFADDWMTWTSTYTHEPFTGQRVDQYAMPVDPVAPYREDFQRSGFRHTRSTLQAGLSADNLHIVEQWGRPIVPYEEWRFPYRPYSVPYGAWGPQAPYGIINGNFGFGGGIAPPMQHNPGYPPQQMPGQAGPGQAGPGQFGPGSWGGPNGFPLQPQYQNQPWFDGTYPSAPPLDPSSDRQFFFDPRR